MLVPRGIQIGHCAHHGRYFFSYWCKICIDSLSKCMCEHVIMRQIMLLCVKLMTLMENTHLYPNQA